MRYELTKQMLKSSSKNRSCGEVVDDEQPDTPMPTVAPTTSLPPTTTTPAPTTTPTSAPTVATSAPTAAVVGLPASTPESTSAPTAKPTPAPTAKPTLAPTAKPTPAPTAKPTLAPTAKPTLAPAPVKCELDVKLGYPFTDANSADYYGYHASMLSVLKQGDDYYECSFYYTGDLPDWCTYENTDPAGDSTFLSNWDDDTYDFIDEELVHIFDAAGGTFIFTVNHYYFGKEYYPEDENFKDHMNTPTLTIENLNGDRNWDDGWIKEVEKDVPAHIKKSGKWVKNPDFEGDFTVTVSCNNNCSCEASYKLI